MKTLFSRKRLFVSIGALAVLGILPFASTPVRAQLQEVTEAIVEAIRRPEVKLTMTAEKKSIDLDVSGQEKITWDDLGQQAEVQPGDILRYTVDGSNSSDIEANNLNITQLIPAQMTYVLDSAIGADDVLITYSIDSGETFVEEPMVEVELADGTVELQPAPAEAYTHINWSFQESLTSATDVEVAYQVIVK